MIYLWYSKSIGQVQKKLERLREGGEEVGEEVLTPQEVEDHMATLTNASWNIDTLGKGLEYYYIFAIERNTNTQTEESMMDIYYDFFQF